METGRNSTDSLPLAEAALLFPEAAEKAVQDALVREAGIGRIGRLIGLKSINRNLENEDEAVKKNIEAMERIVQDQVFGGDGGDAEAVSEMPERTTDAESEMRDIWSGGDVHIHPPAVIPPAPPPVVPPVTPPAKVPTWLKTLAVAGAIGGIGSTGILIGSLLNKPAVVKPDKDTDTQLDFELGKE